MILYLGGLGGGYMQFNMPIPAFLFQSIIHGCFQSCYALACLGVSCSSKCLDYPGLIWESWELCRWQSSFQRHRFNSLQCPDYPGGIQLWSAPSPCPLHRGLLPGVGHWCHAHHLYGNTLWSPQGVPLAGSGMWLFLASCTNRRPKEEYNQDLGWGNHHQTSSEQPGRKWECQAVLFIAEVRQAIGRKLYLGHALWVQWNTCLLWHQHANIYSACKIC